MINRDKIKYVIGIDFGHAETSAAYCEIDWNIETERIKFHDILFNRKKVIVSAICEGNDGSFRIGKDALVCEDIKRFRIGFKEPPKDIDGDSEKLMIRFMKIIYQIILRDNIKDGKQIFEDGNHVVFIARPAEWKTEKDLYIKMARDKAGIPVVDLMSEPRAAITYAYMYSAQISNLRKGGMVFDLGSSTLDLTYVSELHSPVDKGENLGASRIDKVIYHNYLCNNPKIKSYLAKHPQYEDRFLFQARQIKENLYNNEPDCPYATSFSIAEITKDKSSDKESIKITIQGSKELEDISINKEVGLYKSDIGSFVSRFREEIESLKCEHREKKSRPIAHAGKVSLIKNEEYCHIDNVVMTGGATQMRFLKDIVASALNINNKKYLTKDDEPSLTVSRGIAILGTKDCIVNVRKQELQKTLENSMVIDNDELIKIFSVAFEQIWDSIIKETAKWKGLSESGFKNFIKERIKSKCDDLKKSIYQQIFDSIITKNAEIRQEQYQKLLLLYVSKTQVDKALLYGQELSENDIQNKENLLNDLNYSLNAIIGTTKFKLNKKSWFIRIFKFLDTDNRKKNRIINNFKKCHENLRSRCDKDTQKNIEAKAEEIKHTLIDIIKSDIIKELEYVKIPLE